LNTRESRGKGDAMELLHISHKIVDLNRSVWDKSKSKRETGEYVFSSKRYVSYRDKANLPAYYFKWIHYSPRDNYMAIDTAKWDGFTYVTVEDSFWPEPLKPDSGGGFYRFKDVVLMKCPLVQELRRRIDSKKMSDAMAMSTRMKFRDEAKETGAAMTAQDEDELNEMAKSLGLQNVQY